MNYEKSCGVIVFRKEKDKIEYLIICQKNDSHWGFPKGHVEDIETEYETAKREVKEETGLTINILDNFRVTDKYFVKGNTMKEVVFFLGKAEDAKVTIQPEEVTDYKWADEGLAKELLTYESSKKIMFKADLYIKNVLKEKL
ncbi:MAG: NUDIX domain-containing protein [Clostridiaceae bacterium]